MKKLNGPEALVISSGLTMGETAARGLAYVFDANGVCTKAGAGAKLAVFLKKMAANSEQVEGVVVGIVEALASGAVSRLDNLKYGALGTMTVATEGTDDVKGYALEDAADGAYFTMVKIG